MSKPKMPKVVETKGGVYINHHFVPFICCNKDGSSTTKVEQSTVGTKVTITFMARSYSINNNSKHKQYRFKKPSIFRRLFS